MAEAPTTRVTALLAAARADDREAMDLVFTLVYSELRRLAHRKLAGWRGDATLSTTALVNEAYLRLLGAAATPHDRHHFFALAARAMLQIMVDRARRRSARKRGGGVALEVLDEERVGGPAGTEELIAVHRALERLERLDERQGKIVEWRFFGGLSEEEIAEALGLSARTVKREWRKARAFLYQELYGEPRA